MFQRTSIYIKKHNETGLRYFGKTVQNVVKYRGSGKYWKNHLNKHGNNCDTFVVRVFNKDEKQECMDFCIWFSKINNIVKSKKWANLIIENGLDGGYNFTGKKHSLKTKRKMKMSASGKNNPMYGLKHRRVQCPHCLLSGGVNNMSRWHFENCKKKLI